MLRPNLPAPLPKKFITSDMCIPVFPNTQHPSREPIQPVPAIPWSNAYHAAFENAELRVHSALADPTLATFLSASEGQRLFMACAEDSDRQLDSIDKFEEETGASGSSEDDTEVGMLEGDESDMEPFVHMSYNLTSVQNLSDPQEFFEEIGAVKK